MRGAGKLEWASAISVSLLASSFPETSGPLASVGGRMGEKTGL